MKYQETRRQGASADLIISNLQIPRGTAVSHPGCDAAAGADSTVIPLDAPQRAAEAGSPLWSAEKVIFLTEAVAST